MKYIKYLRYIKFALAILFFELILGRICYEYGYYHGSSVYGVGSMYAIAVYALIYIAICLCQGWGETSRSTNIFSTLFLGIPYPIFIIIIVVASCSDLLEVNTSELPFAIVVYIVSGIALALEIAILILHIKQDNLLKKNFEKS